MRAPSDAGAPLRRSLSTPKIVFLVVAAAAPMAGMVGSVPLAFVLGNGAGVPAAFVLAGLTLLCFSVGYAAMSRRVVSTGGFYAYVARGLGRPAAVAGGLVAVIAYNSAVIGVAGAFGYFAELVAASHGLRVSWMLWAALGLAVMGYMGYRRIDLSARVLAVLMIAEVAILVLVAGAIVADRGADAFPAAALSPATVLAPGLGVALMFALISYVGFEAAALYGEETPNPRRSVPLATYTSVVLITAFFALVSWVAVGGIGVNRLAAAAEAELGDLFFNLAGRYLGGTVTTVMQVLLCTSLFGAMLGLHTAANRYLYVLGRERVLPSWLGAVHPRHGGPHRASLAQTAVTVVVCAVFALAGLHPYVNLAPTMLGLGTVGIVALQGAVTVAVIGFFRGRPDRHWWRTAVAPLLALAGLGAALALLLSNFAIVTGTESPLVNRLPWLLVAAAAGGFLYAWWMRAHRPLRYASLAPDVPAARPTLIPAAEPVHAGDA
ncbi:APC family permease [Sphaerisporangium sp. TRM90804]|uniref:APC family permease n=1 Tax=Sphaerisporangium sp. TRM90804 TaxID=3031113 RepID=UPI002447B56D|nr:APC family permease [Sphaerisporangium sp. TRM90804]MDH2428334.1 APC family permease [Sphaerisporangium sp. TRM90804]